MDVVLIVITNSMERSPPSEANSLTAGKETSRFSLPFTQQPLGVPCTEASTV
jgi:hypothetical protein